ncbi:thioesterase II family protein [Kitasatospora azatica]|uniref:thioesterase II family protein n=1 Tax=Kitasatospora azatica TaxID=58347 RepID=UPI0007C6BA85|nr:alpha/beta fold hydrolase [Kitasatospora azatica]
MTRYLSGHAGPAPEAGGRLRLFCFPYAGGGASIYSGWQHRLGSRVQVMPVQLPGREGRSAEPRFTDLESLVDDLDDELGPALEQPHAFFGHSMGALIAFALTQRRHVRGAQLPRCLLLSAYRAPHLPAPQQVAADADESELLESLISLGGIPPIMLDHPEWLSALLPVTRDDLRLCASPGPGPDARVPVPIHAFAGLHDSLVSPAEVRGWSRYSADGFSMRTLPGGHFFLRDRNHPLFAELSQLLASLSLSPTTAVPA